MALVLFAMPARAQTVASLRIHADASTYFANVDTDPSVGYRLAIACIDACSSSAAYREDIGDVPMGLFVRDQDGLLFSLWAGGSAYRVRIWRITDAGIRQVAELSSRGRPEFLDDPQGRPIIHTFDAESGTGPRSVIRWTYDGKAFVRSR
ncbi:hypothetical protein ACG3SL_16470 [Sphingomonas sp. CJ20]